MAKKILYFIIASICIFALSSCGDKNTESSHETDSGAVTSSNASANDISSKNTANSSDLDTENINSENSEKDNSSGENSEDPSKEPYESETYIAKTGSIYEIEYYPITLYVDENGNDNVKVDNFAEIDFSRFTASDMNGIITVMPDTKIYTVSDGIISDGDSDDIISDTMIAIYSYQNDDGNIVTNIYVYQ